jgi:hypothetical protein
MGQTKIQTIRGFDIQFLREQNVEYLYLILICFCPGKYLNMYLYKAYLKLIFAVNFEYIYIVSFLSDNECIRNYKWKTVKRTKLTRVNFNASRRYIVTYSVLTREYFGSTYNG